ncbi:hypothetical protein D9M73_268930 [compost metagenome]
MTARGGGKTAGFQHVEEQGQLVGQLIGFMAGLCLCEFGTAIVRCCAFPCQKQLRRIKDLTATGKML